LDAADRSKQETAGRLKRRRDFVAAREGARIRTPAFTLQARKRDGAERSDFSIRFGFTVAKTAGNSPMRNRIRRRLRQVAARCADGAAPGHDYVLIAQTQAIARPFSTLVAELREALDRATRFASKARRGDPRRMDDGKRASRAAARDGETDRKGAAEAPARQ
jgi:ribonuclease P protein component